METQVAEFLSGFASTPELAATCRTLQIQAVPEACHDCVVAKLLRSQFPEILDASVRPYGRYPTVECSVLGGSFEIALPPAVAEFGRQFDGERYTDLIDHKAWEEAQDNEE